MPSEETGPTLMELSLEEQSFRNLVTFYQDDLREIARGRGLTLTNLSVNNRRRMRKHGVLIDGRGRRGFYLLMVTPEAQAILNEDLPVEGSLTPHKEGSL